MKLNLCELPVYYINLDQDEEKRKSTETLLKRLGFTNVIRVPAVLHEKGKDHWMCHVSLPSP